MRLADLKFGLKYKVIQDFQLVLSDQFFSRDELVFLGSCTIFWDKFDVDHHELHFYDQSREMDLICRYVDPERIEEVLETYFIEAGGWRHPGKGESLPYTVSPGDNATVQFFIPYLKSLVEGDPATENWFFWLKRNSKLLELTLSKMQHLQLKISPIREAKAILDLLGVTYDPSKYFQWLDKKVT
jgi:hypothetical protein